MHQFRGSTRVAATMITDKGQMIHIRKTSEAEPIHVEMYNALRLPLCPWKRVLSID